MNTNTPAHKAKIRHLCSFLVLCLHLTNGAVPGPCKHSVTKEHLFYLKRLIGNQLQNGCSITYTFTERHSLSEVCYIKAAFSHILDLLNTHFRYGRDSDNYNYTSSIKNLIYNVYSQKCIPPINEEIEDNPVKFAKLHSTSPKAGLEKAEEVLQMYKNLVTNNDKPVEWNCEEEYAEDITESTTALLNQVSGTPECQCSCTTKSSTSMKPSVLTRSSPVAPTTVLPARLSLTPVLKHKNEGCRVLKSLVKHKALNSIQTQAFPVLPNSETSTRMHKRTKLLTENPYGSMPGDFPSLISSTPPDLMDEYHLEIESSPSSSYISLPTTELPRILLRRPVLPQSSSTAPFTSDRSTALIIAKRSLDTKVKGILSDFYSEQLQNWITSTTSDPAQIHKRGSHLEITGAPTTNSIQTINGDQKIEAPWSAKPSPSLTITEDISQQLRPSDEQSVQVPTPTKIQSHKAAFLPENVIKTVSKASDCKDSKCRKDIEDTKEQISRDQVEGVSGKDFSFTSSSMNTFIITFVCLVLLLLTALLFCKQRKVRNKINVKFRTKI